MTPKEREMKLHESIEELTRKIDKVLKLLEDRDGKAKTSKRKS